MPLDDDLPDIPDVSDDDPGLHELCEVCSAVAVVWVMDYRAGEQMRFFCGTHAPRLIEKPRKPEGEK